MEIATARITLHPFTVSDAERLLAGDVDPLDGWEGGYSFTDEPELLAEYQVVRAASLAFFGGLNAGQLDRAGRANGNPFTVRGLLYLLAGHEAHHLRVWHERYQPLLAAPASAEDADAALAEALTRLPAAKAAGEVARRLNLDRRALYARALALKG